MVSQFTPDRRYKIMSCWRLLVKRWKAKSPIPCKWCTPRPRSQPPVPDPARRRPAVQRGPHPQRQHHRDRPARRQHGRLPRLARPARCPVRRTRRAIHPARPRLCAGQCGGAIAQLKAHRLAREAKVLAAMQALPDGTPEDWVRHAYSDVPRACGLWPSVRCWPMSSASAPCHRATIDPRPPQEQRAPPP